jgi:hypothetical protein
LSPPIHVALLNFRVRGRPPALTDGFNSKDLTYASPMENGLSVCSLGCIGNFSCSDRRAYLATARDVVARQSRAPHRVGMRGTSFAIAYADRRLLARFFGKISFSFYLLYVVTKTSNWSLPAAPKADKSELNGIVAPWTAITRPCPLLRLPLARVLGSIGF